MCSSSYQRLNSSSYSGGESPIATNCAYDIMCGCASPGLICSHAQRRKKTVLSRVRLVHGEGWCRRWRYSVVCRTPGVTSSYVARYLPSPGLRSATQRRAERKPGIDRRSAICSLSYQALNSASSAGGGSVIVNRRPKPFILRDSLQYSRRE